MLAAGAPLSEELLFRGFLLPALCKATPMFFGSLAAGLVLAQILVPLALRPLVPLPFPLAGSGALAVTVTLLVLVSFLDVARRLRLRGGTATIVEPAHQPSFALAAIFTGAGWMMLHAYSVTGMLQVMMIGLYFAWLMRRYGNLLLPMTLHALYNGVQLAALTLWVSRGP